VLGLPDLRTRHRMPELMDDPRLDDRRHGRALAGLRRLNRLAGTARRLWSELRREPGKADPIRVLDVACGGGDLVLDLARFARASGRGLRCDGCDLSPVAVRFASEAAHRSGYESSFFALDALRDPFPTGYDFLVTSLFLHHLDDGDVTKLLARMAASARRGILVSDLERTRGGYVLAWLAPRAISRSPIVHHDGPVSVRGAFRQEEIRALAVAAGLEGFRLLQVWPERFLLRWTRERGE